MIRTIQPASQIETDTLKPESLYAAVTEAERGLVSAREQRANAEAGAPYLFERITTLDLEIPAYERAREVALLLSASHLHRFYDEYVQLAVAEAHDAGYEINI